MAFVQIIDFRTSKLAEVQEVGNEWEKAAAGKSANGGHGFCAARYEAAASICASV